MRKATIPFITAVLLLTLSASTAWAKSAAELLREGLYAEEVEGNLDAAIGIYQQIILDTTAPKNLVAQALYRQGMCFMKKRDEAKAREVFQKLVNEYADQTDVVEKAKPVLEALGNADPASLMPPETIAYVEIGSPGQQVATILRMLKGTPLENPFNILGMKESSKDAGGGAPAPGAAPSSGSHEKNPVQMFQALLNPSMLAEMEKVRGVGVGILGLAQNNPPTIIVLYPGQSDALKGLLQMGMTAFGSTAEPVEGMTTVTFGDGGSAAYDGTVVIVVSPSPKARDMLQWAIRQYKGRTHEPSLASGNKSFARISKQARQQNALTVWLNVDEAHARLMKMLPADQVPPQLQIADGVVNFKDIDDVIVTLSLRETGIALEANIGFKAGYRSLAYGLLHSPGLDRTALKVVPAEAVALLSFTLGEAGTRQAQAVSDKIKKDTGLDLGPDIFGNIQQVSFFIVPPRESVLPQGPKVPPIAQSFGVAITSRDPDKTQKLLLTLLQVAKLVAPETQQPPTGTGRYEIALSNNMKLFGYTNEINKTLVLSLNSQLVEQSVTAAKQDASVLTGGPLQDALATLSPTTTTVAVVNVAAALLIVEQNSQFASDEEAQRAKKAIEELIRASGKTTIRLLTNEPGDGFGIRLSVSDLPPLQQLFGPISQLAQMIAEEKAKVGQAQAGGVVPISIPPAGSAPTVDGNVDEVWNSVPAHAISHVVYTPPSSEADLTANFKMMYDNQALYILVDVTDDRLVSDSAEYWMDDGVEVFIAAENNKSDVYGDKDYQYHFDWDNTAPAMGESHRNNTNGVQYAFARTDKGYRLEAKLPWTTLGTTPAPGKKIGLDVHVNDDDDGGDRDTKIMWFGTHDIAWQQPSAFGTAELGGLVAWWKLDEAEGTAAADSSGNGHNATLHGNAKWLPSGGKIGGALQLDGAHDYADTGYNTDLATWTVALWVKSPAAPTTAKVPSGPVHREANFQINWNHYRDGARGAAGLCLGSTWHNASFGSLDGGVWYHLVATFDGQSIKAYKDGILVGEDAHAAGRPNREPLTLKLGRHAKDEGYFAGTIDDVRLYNYALPEAQVRQLYQEVK